VRTARSSLPIQMPTDGIEVKGLTQEDTKRLVELLGKNRDPATVGNVEVSLDQPKSGGDLRILRMGPRASQRGNSFNTTKTNNPSHGVITIQVTFKLVFLSVLFLTVVSGIAAIAMAFAGDVRQQNQQEVFESMNTAWKLGLGAIFGLLGGKTVS